MIETTPQMAEWSGEFGREYTDRNIFSPEELDAFWQKNFGKTRSELNERFLRGMDRSIRILEVGCNAGNQLLMLQEMGFTNLYGIEIQAYAISRARLRAPKANIVQASAFDIPFKDGYFGLVFTAGVLIHINPASLDICLGEIHRCSREYIWGTEYFDKELRNVSYRGHEELMWKGDYAGQYLQRFGDLEMIRQEEIKYHGSEEVDSMFLLRKQSGNGRA